MCALGGIPKNFDQLLSSISRWFIAFEWQLKSFKLFLSLFETLNDEKIFINFSYESFMEIIVKSHRHPVHSDSTQQKFLTSSSALCIF